MKKTLLYLVVLALTAFSAKGQVTFTKNWEIKPAATGSLIGQASLETTIAYNKVTDKLYLPERNNKISILKPSDGTLSSPSTLPTLTNASHAGWGASYKYTKIRVTTDGVIYACNMTLSGATDLYIYRWASETDAAPTVSTIDVNYRTGDSFAISGTGTNTIIYISGANSPEIYVCKTTNGTTFTLDHIITLGAISDARSSISPVSNSLTSDLWINTLNVEVRRISSNSAGVVTATNAVATSLIDQKYSHAEYFEEAGEKYLAVSGAHDATLGLNFKLYKITNFPTSPTAVTEIGSGVLAPTSYTANANAYADAAFVRNTNGTYTFYHLDTNNGLAAYTSLSTLPVSLTSFGASLQNGQSTLSWQTTSESNNKGFEIQRSVDGKEFTAIAFENSKATNGNSSSVLDYTFVDKNALSGTNYYRLKQIDLNGDSKMYAIKAVNINIISADVQVYPNPVTSYVKIKVANYEGLEYKLYDAAGKVIITEKASQEETELSTLGLSPSLYVLKIIKGIEELKTIKIIKQ